MWLMLSVDLGEMDKIPVVLLQLEEEQLLALQRRHQRLLEWVEQDPELESASYTVSVPPCRLYSKTQLKNLRSECRPRLAPGSEEGDGVYLLDLAECPLEGAAMEPLVYQIISEFGISWRFYRKGASEPVETVFLAPATIACLLEEF